MPQLSSVLLAVLVGRAASDTVTVGTSLEGVTYGWTDGLCYRDVVAQLGDVLVFSSGGGHNLVDIGYQPVDGAEGMCDVDFDSPTSVEELAGIGAFPYSYTITTSDVSAKELKFVCTVGAHCRAGQRLRVVVVAERTGPLLSLATAFTDTETCDAFRESGEVSAASWADRPSTCGEIETLPDGRKSRSCLSPPMTFHPGGVINEMRTLFFPYPHDTRAAGRVVLSDRVFEMVEYDTHADGTARSVPLAELYIHHLAGNMVFGQGSEGLGRVEPEFAVGNLRTVTGTEQDWMIFHLIAPQRGHNGTYGVGGIDCCFNCTTVSAWTGADMRDYYMRYNVTWREIEGEYVEVGMLTADISPAVGKTIEYDVPALASGVQSLRVTKPFDEMFHHGFFGELYAGPADVGVVRCVGHQHVAAIGMWLYDAETNDTLCESYPVYGTAPGVDAGMVTDLSREDFEPPRVVPRDRRVTLRTDYNATQQHTGVMGMLFLFYDTQHAILPPPDASSKLLLAPCVADECDVDDLLDYPEGLERAPPPCGDVIDDHPMCRFGGECDCAELIEEQGCGNVWETTWGDLAVDEVCPGSCDLCNGTDSEEHATDALLAEVSTLAEAHCAAPTDACGRWLGNLLACADTRVPKHEPIRLGLFGSIFGVDDDSRADELTDEVRAALAAPLELLAREHSNWLQFEVDEVKGRTFAPCTAAPTPTTSPPAPTTASPPPPAASPPPTPGAPGSASGVDAALGGIIGGCVAGLALGGLGCAVAIRRYRGKRVIVSDKKSSRASPDA